MRRVPRRVVGAMINLVRAQWFRLMRNRAFWGLLAVFAGVVLVASLQVTERGLYEEAYRNIPLLAQHSPAAMVSMTMDVEAVMGEFWTPQLLALIIALLSAGFFGDDFRFRRTRLLAAGPHFRAAYVISALFIALLSAMIFLAAAVAATWAGLLPNPGLGVWVDGGRFGRWALELMIIAATYALVVLAVVAATGRTGWGALVAVLLSGGVASTALLSVSWALGCEEVLRPLIAAMPAAQLGQLSIEGVTPGAFDILPLLGWLAAAAGLCWAVLRRRAL